MVSTGNTVRQSASIIEEKRRALSAKADLFAHMASKSLGAKNAEGMHIARMESKKADAINAEGRGFVNIGRFVAGACSVSASKNYVVYVWFWGLNLGQLTLGCRTADVHTEKLYGMMITLDDTAVYSRELFLLKITP
jgi:hypothetical protein